MRDLVLVEKDRQRWLDGDELQSSLSVFPYDS